jgi:hypothetical protein
MVPSSFKVGEIAVAIDGPVSEPVGGSFVNTGYAAGIYLTPSPPLSLGSMHCRKPPFMAPTPNVASCQIRSFGIYMHGPHLYTTRIHLHAHTRSWIHS